MFTRDASVSAMMLPALSGLCQCCLAMLGAYAYTEYLDQARRRVYQQTLEQHGLLSKHLIFMSLTS